MAVAKRRHEMQPWKLDEAPRPDLIGPGLAFLGECIYHARIYLGYSQQRLADLAGLSQSTLSRLENGKLQGMRLHRLVPLLLLLADGLEVAITIWRRRRGDAVRRRLESLEAARTAARHSAAPAE